MKSNLKCIFKALQLDYISKIRKQIMIDFVIQEKEKFKQTTLDEFFTIVECSKIK